MMGHSFDGMSMATDSPEGGTVVFGIGYLKREEESPKEAAVYYRIEDKHGSVVAEFALTKGTFEVLVALMREVMRKAEQGALNIVGTEGLPK